MNLANLLTASRVFLAPIIPLVLVSGLPQKDLIAALVFGIAACTDFLDGRVARSRSEVTEFGKSFDPLADKVLVAAALVPLAVLHYSYITWWVVGIILGREVMVTILRALVAHRRGPIAASWLGKCKTASQSIAVIWVLLPMPLDFLPVAVAVFFTVLSGFDYLYKWLPIIIRSRS